jgi:HAD superfamily hydrolase (TIGR01549 family)
MEKVNHWVFDLDGTVVNSSQHYEESLITILDEHGVAPHQIDMNLAYKFFNPAEFFATYLADESKIEKSVKHLVELNQRHADKIPAHDGIVELFEFLKSKGMEISIWTGREHTSAKSILNNLELTKHITHCVSRTCVPKNKPHPDGLLKILKDSNLHHTDAVMIGDHAYDIQAARASRVKCISVGWDSRAHHEVRDLSDIHFDLVDDFFGWTKQWFPQRT